jgi:hypothetical protein
MTNKETKTKGRGAEITLCVRFKVQRSRFKVEECDYAVEQR